MVKIKSLKEAEEFRRIKLEGTRFSEGGLDVFITPEENGVSKIGVQVSSKIANSSLNNTQVSKNTKNKKNESTAM